MYQSLNNIVLVLNIFTIYIELHLYINSKQIKLQISINLLLTYTNFIMVKPFVKNKLLVFGLLTVLVSCLIFAFNKNLFQKIDKNKNISISKINNNNFLPNYIKTKENILLQTSVLKQAININNNLINEYKKVFKYKINYCNKQENKINNIITISNLSINHELSNLYNMNNIINNHKYNYLYLFREKNYFIPKFEFQNSTKISSLSKSIKSYDSNINVSNINMNNISYYSEEAFIGAKSISSLLSNSKKLLISKINFNYNNVYYFSNSLNSLITLNKDTSILNDSRKNDSYTSSKFISNLKTNQVDNSNKTKYFSHRKKNVVNYIIKHPYIIATPIIGFTFIATLIVVLTKAVSTKKLEPSDSLELNQILADLNANSPESAVTSKVTINNDPLGTDLDLIQDIITDDSVPSLEFSPELTYTTQNNYQPITELQNNIPAANNINSTSSYPYSDSPYYKSTSLGYGSDLAHKTGTKRKNYSRISGYNHRDTKKSRSAEYQDISNSDLVSYTHPTISQDGTRISNYEGVTEGSSIPVLHVTQPVFIADEHKFMLNKIGLSAPIITSSYGEKFDWETPQTSRLSVLNWQKGTTTTILTNDRPITHIPTRQFSTPLPLSQAELNIPVHSSFSQLGANLSRPSHPNQDILAVQEITRRRTSLDDMLNNEEFFRFLYDIRSHIELKNGRGLGILPYSDFKTQISSFLYLESIEPNMGTSDIVPFIIKGNIQSRLADAKIKYCVNFGDIAKCSDLMNIGSLDRIIPVNSTTAKTKNGWFAKPSFERDYKKEKITKEEYDLIKIFYDRFERYLFCMPILQESPTYYNELSLVLKKSEYNDSIFARSEERNKFVANEILLDLKEVIVTYRSHLYVSWMKYSDLESKPNEITNIPNYSKNFCNTFLVKDNFGKCDHTGLTEKHIAAGIKSFFNNFDFKS